MKLKRDEIAGIVLVLIGILVFALCSQFEMPFKPEYPGPRLLPMIAATGLIICGIGIFVTGRKKEEKPYVGKGGWLRMLQVMAVMIAYVFLMKFFGFLPVTVVAVYILTTLFAKGFEVKRKSKILYSALFSLLIYGVYVYVFGMSLPRGILF